MTKQVSRRELGKGLVAACLVTPLCPAEAPAKPDTTTAWNNPDSSGAIQVAPGIWKITVGTPEAITPVKTRLVAAKSLSYLTAAQSDLPVRLSRSGIRERGVELALPLAPNEEIFGLGLQFFSLAHRGTKKTLRVNADPRADTGDSHAPVPFYVSSRGYGALIDTARYATFYCGESRPKPTLPIERTLENTHPRYTDHLPQDQATEVLIEVPNCQGIDVYIFGGPTMLEAVRRYNLFSGGGALPPEWGLGFFYRTTAKATAEEVLATADEFRRRNIPCDVMGLEPGWQSHAYPCSFVWNDKRFPRPKEFVEQLRLRDMKLNLWEHPFIDPTSPLFPELQNFSGDRAVWGGLVPDFQDVATRKAFGRYHAHNFLDLGVSGFKLDECDNSDYTGGWSFAELSQFPSGADGEQMHSLFGLRYQKAIWQQFEDRSETTYSLVRSSGALASPYPFVLYSDLYDHRQFVRALVNSGFSGLLWCPEVRDASSEEDLIRRLQTVVFSPLAMVDAWYIANPPWKQLDRRKNNAGELLSDWEALETRCREIIGWRMQIIPYLWNAFAKYAEDGTPPFRALVLDWPDVPALTNVDDAWAIGDRMLVAPLFAGEERRTITLPPGEWHDLWTAKRYDGGSKFEIPASYEKIPVFVKSGSVLPLATITHSTSDPARRKLTVHVFGDGHLPFEMKLPSGESLFCRWNQATGRGELKTSGWRTPFIADAWVKHD